MSKKIVTWLCILALMAATFAVGAAADAANAVASIGCQYFDTLEAAVDAVDAANPGGTVITLRKDVASASVDATVYLDLAGKNIASVDVAEGVTLYCLDSETDDYAIEGDEETGYTGFGRIATVTGEGKVAGAEAGMIPVEPTEEYRNGCLDGYLMVNEEGKGLSFHRANLQITAMTLRANDPVGPSVYYKSAFGGDALVAANVKTFGVALSVQEEPNAQNMGLTNVFSWFEGEKFIAGLNDGDATSTLLQGIMKESNAKLKNRNNANMPVFGRAYIQTEDGFVFGVCADRTLKQQAEGVAAKWDKLGDEQKKPVMAMYDTYRAIMHSWTVEPIADEPRDFVRILGIGNSYTVDSMRMLGEVYKAEGNTKKLTLGIAYNGGCTLAEHNGYIDNNSPDYSYYSLNEDGTWSVEKDVTLRYILQQEDWDLVSMQQASDHSGWISTYDDSVINNIRGYVERILGYTPTYMWNMTWAWPVEDLEGDAFTTVTKSSNFAKLYGSNQHTMYRMIVDCVKQKIVTDSKFEYIMPVGTAIHNARGTHLRDADLHRDGSHVSDLGRVIAAYVWYCEIEGATLGDAIKLRSVPERLTYSWPRAGQEGDMPIDELTATAIAQSVKDAMQNKFESTYIMQDADPAEDDALNILMVGNSFCFYYVEELYGLLAAAGYEDVNICNVYSSGCVLDQHLTWFKNGNSKYTSFASTTAEGRKVIYSDVSLDTCLEYANWDYISLQGTVSGAPSYQSDAAGLEELYQTIADYAEPLLDHFHKQYPDAQLLWHRTWPFEVGRVSGDYTYDEAGLAKYDAGMQWVCQQMTTRFATERNKDYTIAMVNSGAAWTRARQANALLETSLIPEKGGLCARLGVEGGKKTFPYYAGEANIGDGYHDGDIGGGQLLNACVWYETITGKCCLENSYRPTKDNGEYELSEAFTQLLKTAACTCK